MKNSFRHAGYLMLFGSLFIFTAILFLACRSSPGNGKNNMMPPPPALPVFTVTSQPATIYQEYTASLEGSRDIEIRPQVEGYLDNIYVDEGAHVKKGQLLFKINAQPYIEQLN